MSSKKEGIKIRATIAQIKLKEKRERRTNQGVIKFKKRREKDEPKSNRARVLKEEKKTKVVVA